MPDVSQLQTRIASALQISYQEAGVLAARMAPVILIDDIAQIGDSSDVATRWCMQQGSAAGAGAVLAQVALTNPVGSGMRLITEQVIMTGNSTGEISGGFRTGTGLAVAAQGVYRDSGPGVPAGIVNSGDQAATGDDTFNLAVATLIPMVIPFETVIDPGVQMFFFRVATAQILGITWFWKEIKLPALI